MSDGNCEICKEHQLASWCNGSRELCQNILLGRVLAQEQVIADQGKTIGELKLFLHNAKEHIHNLEQLLGDY